VKDDFGGDTGNVMTGQCRKGRIYGVEVGVSKRRQLDRVLMDSGGGRTSLGLANQQRDTSFSYDPDPGRGENSATGTLYTSASALGSTSYSCGQGGHDSLVGATLRFRCDRCADDISGVLGALRATRRQLWL